MKRKSLGLLSIIVACAAAASITIASCDNNATDPPNPGKGGGGKTPEVMAQSVSVDLNGIGGTIVTDVPDIGDLDVTNFNAGGTRSKFLGQATTWSQSVDGNWPASGNGGVNLVASTPDGQASTLTIGQEGDGLIVTPTFSGGSEPEYRLALYNNTDIVATIPVPVGQPLIFYPYYPYYYPCCWIRRWGFGIHPWWGYCYWNLYWGPCCWWRWWWNGNWWYFNRAAFLEGVEGTHYPYTNFSQIDVMPSGGGVDNYRVSDETAR